MSTLKPLYLDGREDALMVGLLERALLIRCSSKADALCPLARLERVQCWGEVWWSGEALAACGLSGVTVAFHKGHDTASVAVPSLPRARSFAAILDAGSSQERAAAALADWAAHRASRAKARALARQPLLAGAGDARTRRCERRVMPLYEVWLRRRLARAGVGQAYLGPSSARPNLLRLFRNAGAPDLGPLILALAEDEARLAGDKAGMRRAATGFQAEAPYLAARFADAWRSFEAMVRDLAEGADLWDG